MSTQTPSSMFSTGVHDSSAEVVVLTAAVRNSTTAPRTTALRPVSNRSAFASKGPSDGKRPAYMSRVHETLAAPGNLAEIRVAYANVLRTTVNGALTESDGPNTITIRAAIEFNPTNLFGTWSAGAAGAIVLPLYVQGRRTITLEPGGSVLTDSFDYPFVPGQTVYIRTYSSTDGSGVAPINRQLQFSFLEGANNGWFPASVPLGTTTPATTFSGTVNNVVLPILPGALFISGGTITGPIADNGSGGWATGNGIAAGSTINYTTGAFTINTTTSMAPNALTFTGYGLSGTTPADDTLTTGSVANLNPYAAVFAHSDVFGRLAGTESASPFGILVVGDSISLGLASSDGQTGWVDYALGTAIGRTKIACSSETAASFASIVNRQRRLRMATATYDRIIENYATNDFGASVSLAAVQASKLAIWSALAAKMPNGYRDIWVATLLPRTVSAGSSTPFNSSYGPGTVASGTPSARNALNAWLYTQIGVTIGGVIDIAAAVENAPNSVNGAGDGLWRLSSLTADGTHPSAAGYQAIAALVGLAGTSPSGIFIR